MEGGVFDSLDADQDVLVLEGLHIHVLGAWIPGVAVVCGVLHGICGVHGVVVGVDGDIGGDRPLWQSLNSDSARLAGAVVNEPYIDGAARLHRRTLVQLVGHRIVVAGLDNLAVEVDGLVLVVDLIVEASIRNGAGLGRGLIGRLIVVGLGQAHGHRIGGVRGQARELGRRLPIQAAVNAVFSAWDWVDRDSGRGAVGNAGDNFEGLRRPLDGHVRFSCIRVQLIVGLRGQVEADRVGAGVHRCLGAGVGGAVGKGTEVHHAHRLNTVQFSQGAGVRIGLADASVGGNVVLHFRDVHLMLAGGADDRPGGRLLMVVVALHAHQDRIAGAGVQPLKDITVLPVDAAIDAVLGARDGGGSQGGGFGFLQGGHRGFLGGFLDDQLGRVGAVGNRVTIFGGKVSRHLILSRIGGRGHGGPIVFANIGDGHRGDAGDIVGAMVGLGLPIVGSRLILQDRS